MDVVDNRRGNRERRQFDGTLATGRLERRHIVERRRPEMDVLRLSNTDWQAYFGDSPSEKSSHKIAQETNVFNKAPHDER